MVTPIHVTTSNDVIVSMFGTIALIIVLIWFIDKLFKLHKKRSQLEDMYTDIERTALNEHSKKRGWNIQKFLKETELKDQKSFQRHLEEELITEYFGKNGEKKNG